MAVSQLSLTSCPPPPWSRGSFSTSCPTIGLWGSHGVSRQEFSWEPHSLGETKGFGGDTEDHYKISSCKASAWESSLQPPLSSARSHSPNDPCLLAPQESQNEKPLWLDCQVSTKRRGVSPTPGDRSSPRIPGSPPSFAKSPSAASHLVLSPFSRFPSPWGQPAIRHDLTLWQVTRLASPGIACRKLNFSAHLAAELYYPSAETAHLPAA